MLKIDGKRAKLSTDVCKRSAKWKKNDAFIKIFSKTNWALMNHKLIRGFKDDLIQWHFYNKDFILDNRKRVCRTRKCHWTQQRQCSMQTPTTFTYRSTISTFLNILAYQKILQHRARAASPSQLWLLPRSRSSHRLLVEFSPCKTALKIQSDHLLDPTPKNVKIRSFHVYLWCTYHSAAGSW